MVFDVLALLPFAVACLCMAVIPSRPEPALMFVPVKCR